MNTNNIYLKELSASQGEVGTTAPHRETVGWSEKLQVRTSTATEPRTSRATMSEGESWAGRQGTGHPDGPSHLSLLLMAIRTL